MIASIFMTSLGRLSSSRVSLISLYASLIYKLNADGVVLIWPRKMRCSSLFRIFEMFSCYEFTKKMNNKFSVSSLEVKTVFKLNYRLILCRTDRLNDPFVLFIKRKICIQLTQLSVVSLLLVALHVVHERRFGFAIDGFIGRSICCCLFQEWIITRSTAELEASWEYVQS